MKQRARVKPEFLNIALFILTALLLFWTAVLLNLSLALPTLLLAIFIYLKASNKIGISRLALKLGFLLALFTAVSYGIVHHSTISPLFVPVCAVSMLTVILFNDLRLGLAVNLFCAIEAGAIISNSFAISAVFLIAGLIASLCVWQTSHRARIINAGLISGLIQALTFLFFYSAQDLTSPDFLKLNILPLIVNGLVCSFLVIGSLPFFESLFNALTNIRLLELSDFNHPLLKRLILEAPGTYQHSLVVGNLAEVASEAIGANSLLARVGAYYHDIGKLEKAEYFSENQAPQLSKHDKIFPSISKLIIVNHVKDGIDLARKFKLNPLIVDFICQHHGTSLTYYFYCRALEGMEENQEIKEEGFRYPGPKPQTKEIAIVHLADSIEAATRSLEEPMPSRIEELVRKIINNKFIDGQLDECELTLKDLEKIASTFTRILSAMYHSRIKYPSS